MRKILGLVAISLLAFSHATPALAKDDSRVSNDETRPPMSARDLVTMPRLGTPIVSADGKYAIYNVTYTDNNTLDRAATTYLRDLDDPEGEARILNLDDHAHNIAFGPDNWLFFLSDRAIGEENPEASYSRIWRARLKSDGTVSSPVLMLDAKLPVAGFHLAPNGREVAYWAEVPRECNGVDCGEEADDADRSTGSGRLYQGDAGFYRHWDRWKKPGVYNRVFVTSLNADIPVIQAGQAKALDTPSSQASLTGDTPTKPFGGGEDIAWAADSSGLWFVARQAGTTEPISTNLDIWWNNIAGTQLTNLTAANRATDTLPTPSPDGKYLAYLAMERPGYESDRLVIQLRDLETGQTRTLTQDFDRSFGSLAWTPDSRWLLATAQDVLDTPVFRIDPQSGKVDRLNLMAGAEAHLGNVTPLPKDRLLFTRDAISSPKELYLSQGLKPARPLTSISGEILGNRASVTTTRFSFKGADGDTVWGQITRLENQQGPIPAILYIHGGPQGSFNDGWSSRWNPRVVASQGYAVISVDFHGSTGYGQAFTDSINRDWGGKPLEDLKLGLAAALARDPQIDGSRACAMGASYGGYMVNWIAGQWPDRFKCLVQHDGLFDMRSFYYTTEELWFPRRDFGGSYSEQARLYEKWNPANHLDKWQTPMLVITGEQDFRVPYTQGLASFTALQERQIPSELLVFPDENHWVLKPANSLQWHNTVFAWLRRWLSDETLTE